MNYELRIKNYASKKLLFLVIGIFLAMPILANALPPTKIIPDCPGYNECGFNELLMLVKNIIDWVIWISVPLSALVFAWAGILYMTTAIAGQKDKAKDMLWKVFWGLVMILAAWIIVTTITNALLSESFKNVVPLR